MPAIAPTGRPTATAASAAGGLAPATTLGDGTALALVLALSMTATTLDGTGVSAILDGGRPATDASAAAAGASAAGGSATRPADTEAAVVESARTVASHETVVDASARAAVSSRAPLLMMMTMTVTREGSTLSDEAMAAAMAARTAGSLAPPAAPDGTTELIVMLML